MSDFAIEHVAKRLRTLAQEFSRGRLSFEAYRRERTALLDSITPPPPHLPAAADTGHERTATQAARSEPVSNFSLTRWTRPLFLGALAACAAVTFLIWPQTRHAGLESRRVPGSSAPAHPAAGDRIQGLVAPLLSDPDWDDAHIAAVNAALLEEGPLRIAAHQKAEWFQRFAAEVRRRLKQQPSQQSTLAELAMTIGLDPNALDEPLRPPRPH
jgi:hypothetical protein